MDTNRWSCADGLGTERMSEHGNSPAGDRWDSGGHRGAATHL